MTTQHAMMVLFAWVFANQGGIPIPVVPSLVAAGTMAGAGHASVLTTVAVIVGAALAADVVWYGLGRSRGSQALALVGRLSRRAAAGVELANRRFVAHQLGFLFGSRFLPEANPIAAGLAGAAGIAPRRYFLVAATSALIWAGAWTGAGYVLGNVTLEIQKPFGVVTTFALLAGVIAAVGFALKHRRRKAIALVMLTVLACAGCAVDPDYQTSRVASGTAPAPRC